MNSPYYGPAPGILALLLAAGVTAASAGTDGGIKHVVLCWLAEPGNSAHLHKVIEASRQLRAIPGIDDLSVGPSVPSQRPVVDDSFDVGVVMDFRDQATMNAYLDHPEHLGRVQQIFQPLCGRIRIYDIAY